jgi:addiction module RelB/DinJ family antitoxin
MTVLFRCRVESKLLAQAAQVAADIGTSPAEVVRLCLRQMVNRRAIPFPLQAETPEDEMLAPTRRRAEMWDEMNEGKPAAR